MGKQGASLAHDVLRYIGRDQPRTWQNFIRKEVVLGTTAVAVLTYVVSLFLPAGFVDLVLKALAAVAAGASFAFGYIQWHLARHETSFDKFYERINIANQYIDSVGTKEARNSDEELNHLRNMRVFAQLDNLEYILGKHQLNFVEFDLVDRAVRTFRAECNQPWFRDKVRDWIGSTKDKAVTLGYKADTCKVAVYIVERSEKENEAGNVGFVPNRATRASSELGLKTGGVNDMAKTNNSGETQYVPLPFALGGIGFIIGLLDPGTIDGGWGFLIGFVLGFSVIILKVFRGEYIKKRSENNNGLAT